LLKLSDFDYALPADRIAQSPLPRRDTSRLLAVDRATGGLAHRRVSDLPEHLRPGDVVVLNDTRVTAHRLFGSREGHPGERVETFLTHRVADGLWRALVKPGKKLTPGVVVAYEGGLTAEVLETTDARGGRLLRLHCESGQHVEDAIAAIGMTPLPPYIKQVLPRDQSERYQTIYARREGSAAAPTAGLHLTEELFARIRAAGATIATVTLSIGLGTFRPIETEDIADHVMHAERVSIGPETVEAVNGASGRIVAIGTTTARALESAAVGPGRIAPFDRETDLFIMPGYRFQVVEALMTNFHAPRSSLLVMVSALAGADLVRRAYTTALEEGYRFLSFGDAMFIY
jgi:S-adenosylmethionine:tRNA ribosyltransferase-isomerase